MNSRKDDDLLWIGRLIKKSPLPPLLLSYLLFILIFGIYLYLDSRTERLTLYSGNILLWSGYQVLFTSILIPFELIAIVFLLNASRDEFKKMDLLFSGSRSEFYGLFNKKIIGQELNYFFLLLLIGIPLIFLGWSGLRFYNLDGSSIHLAIDIFNNLLLIISVYLFCIIFWTFINIYWVFHLSSSGLDENLTKYNTLILRRKIMSVRNFFTINLLIFIITISALYISSMKTEYIVFNNYFLVGLFLFAMISTVIGIRDAHGIIEKVIDHKLYFLNNNIESARMKLDSIADDDSSIGVSESKDRNIEADKLGKMIETYEKDWDRTIKENTGLDLKDSVKEAGTFLVSIIIPMLTFLIGNKFI
jgi:hypothetical protein